MKEFEVSPDISDPRLFEEVEGLDHEGQTFSIPVIVEKPLALYLNSREIVTMMTIGDYPEYLAIGYLLNQNMLSPSDQVTGVEYDEDLEVVIVRTENEADFEDKLKKKIQTSGCAQGTVFGDVMEKFEDVALDQAAVLKTSWIYELSRKINRQPSLYLKVGAIHGCVLCEGNTPLIYMEDVGRHNAIDKIAGYMWSKGISPKNKIFYTTGRLTSEMVIKTVQMEIPILISRSGFTAWGVELARQAGLTLIGRAKGKRFQCVSGIDRLEFDADPEAVMEEDRKHQRKGSQ
ncbi:formate dehydrogenase accessory sulfurtransferase FdhD [Sneathiella limimaris]|uniref:formate dehydrogenase accessory sulfurtransferase FdhD n=1 Tax=Sneathiella limimaris TaxID=1964213 RepID=UPI00146E0E50|nr:formate dehydrogenase accessory sulfurtransferase FdhD [Sneathiella limimaris]